MWVQSLGWEDPPEEDMATHSIILAWRIPVEKGFPGTSDGKESACNVGDSGSVPGLTRSPGEGNGNRSSILAWRTPWTEEPGGLQSLGSQRVSELL